MKSRSKFDKYTTDSVHRGLDERVVRPRGGRSPATSSAPRVLADERAILVELGWVLIFILAEAVRLAVQRFLVIA